MQKILQFFLELLQVSSGNLNIGKCDCFAVLHWWSGGKSTLLKIHDPHPIMTIAHPHSGELKTITKKDPMDAHRALRWMMMTDCKSTAKFLVLKYKAKLFSGTILQSRMQQYEASTAYNFYYLASILYTTAETHLYLEQCKSIQSHVV
jgi:hypothetical protein